MSRKSTDPASFARRVAARLATLLKPRTVFLGEANGDPDLLVASFQAWCAAHAGVACEIALSSRWVVSCVPPAGAGAMTARELRQYAQRQISHYLDDARETPEAGWRIATSVRTDRAVACAVSRDLVDRLKVAARTHRVSIQRIFPWWVAMVTPHQDASHDVVVAEPGISTVFQFTQGRLCRVGTEFDVEHLPSDAMLLWTRDEPMPVACDAAAVSAVVIPKPWHRRTLDLDLLESPPRASIASWLLLLVAVTCALVESQRAEGLRVAQEREQALLGRMQASHARVRQPTRPASAATVASASPQSKALEAGAAMLSLQQHPWADVFAGVEAAGSGVAILGLQHDASQSAIDIELAVPNDDAAWGFAERMASDTKRFGSATLLTRQPLEPPVGGMGERARVQAVLAADVAEAHDAQRGAR